VSFIGPSGSGKTTVLNLIGALDRPTSGRLTVSGTDIASLDRRTAALFRGRTIGFIFQEFNLIPVLTAYENVEYPSCSCTTWMRRSAALECLAGLTRRTPRNRASQRHAHESHR